MVLTDDRSTEEISEERLALYRKGLSDKEISEKTGVTRSAVQAWRDRRNLPPNPPKSTHRIGKGLEGNIRPYLVEKIEQHPHLNGEQVASEILESLDEKMEKEKAWREAKRLLNEKLSGTGAKDVVAWAGEEIGISEKVAEEAKRLISRYGKERPLSGSPTALASGAIYLAAILLDERVTQERITEALDLSEPTVIARWQEMAEVLNLEYSHTVSGLPKVEEPHEKKDGKSS